MPSPFKELADPIAVFDAGIGSYALVERIRAKFPSRDIIYFADRARFPYGGKTRAELHTIIRDSINYLISLGAQAVVLASNAPSIMVLDELRDGFSVQVHGVEPPLAEAIALSRTGHVAILGVQSMIASAELGRFVAGQTAQPDRVALINASAMVELVESGAFLLQPQQTAGAVAEFCDHLASQYPDLDVLTLSSTHLPWLRGFFERARPDWRFLDPADRVIAALPHSTGGSGRTQALVSETPVYSAGDFQEMLRRLGIDLPFTVVDPAINRVA